VTIVEARHIDGTPTREHLLFVDEDGEPHYGKKAFLNPGLWSLDIGVPRFAGSRSYGLVKFSVPRVAADGRDNLLLVGQTETAMVIGRVQEDLERNGIKADLFAAKVVRIDITRNIVTDHPFFTYRPVLTALPFPLSMEKHRTDYGSSLRWENGELKLVGYDKCREMRLRKARHPIMSGKNITRFELRCGGGSRGVQKRLGIVTTQDLLDNFDSVMWYFIEFMGDIFRMDAVVPDGIVITDELEILKHYRSKKCRTWFAKYKYARYACIAFGQSGKEGIRELLNKAVDNRLISRATMSRELQLYREAVLTAELLGINSGIPLGQLYRELREKLLSEYGTPISESLLSVSGLD